MTRVRIPAVRAAALLGCALAARAEDRSPSQGIETPARSFAVEDSATSLSGNPAGLSYSSGLVLDFADEHGWRGPARGGDGLYLSAASRGLAAGLALEWLRTGEECAPATPCSRRFTVGGALRFGFLALGAAHHGFSSDESPDLDHVGSWTVGALARPLRWLSLGYGVRDLNAPQFGASQLPRRHVAAVAVRPLQEWFTVAADALFRSCAPSVLQSCGIEHPDLSFSLEARILRGVSLVGQVGRADSGSVTGQVGLQLDFAHLGVRSGTSFGGGFHAQSRTVVRLSSVAEPGIRVPVGRAVELDLDRALRRPSPGLVELVLGETYRDPLALTLEAMRRLSGDPGVKAVVLRTGGLPLGAGRSDELRSGIEGLRAAGKKVAFYLESAGDLDYSVASSADRVFAAPQAVLAVNGFSATALFAAAGLDKLGVKAEFVRAGAYKNAPDLFTRSDMSGEQREVANALLDDLFGRYVRRVAEARHLDEGRFRRLLDKGLLAPREAQAEGLIDGLVYPDQLEEEVGKLVGSRIILEKGSTRPPSERSLRWTPPPTVAVVRVEGDILRAESGSDPLGLVEIAGSESIARRIRALADDPAVKAIVVRIDSPGGDGNASDLIWRELYRARKEKGKPVVASMGDVAASGGYYVAAAADEIVAEPSTITGSIGVFIGKFDAEELYGKLGLHLVTTRRGKSADLFSSARALTGEERAMMQGWVDAFYDQFVDRVAEGRRLSREQVDAVGRGRVWTGRQAQERGLVDRLGGFAEAIRIAKARAGIAPDEAVRLDDPGKSRVSLGPGLDIVPAALRPIPERTLRALSLLGEPGTLRAVLPFDLEVN